MNWLRFRDAIQLKFSAFSNNYFNDFNWAELKFQTLQSAGDSWADQTWTRRPFFCSDSKHSKMSFECEMKNQFEKFNKSFFGEKLHDVKLEFSDNMKKSAGIFYPPNKQRNYSQIRLNRPMLSLRSDKERIETLLVRNTSLDQQLMITSIN